MRNKKTEKCIVEMLRDLNEQGRTINYTKTYNFYKCHDCATSDAYQYRVAVSYAHRSALQLELIGHDLEQIVGELKEWRATI
jgi:hypothetical protein